jgi:hypothetical protein
VNKGGSSTPFIQKVRQAGTTQLLMGQARKIYRKKGPFILRRATDKFVLTPIRPVIPFFSTHPPKILNWLMRGYHPIWRMRSSMRPL